jgi:hypothetical protein
MRYIYFNEEWNKDYEKQKDHNIDSISDYTPRGDNTIGYTKRDTLSDLYFFE